MWNWHSLTDCTQNNLSWSPAQLCQTTSRTAVVWNQSRCPSDLLQAAAVREVQFDFIRFRDEKCLPSNHHSTRRTTGFMHQSVPRSDTPIPAATHALNIQQVGYDVCCRVNNGYDWTDIFWIDPTVKVDGQYYCDVLLSRQMLPAIKRVAERCLFTKQYVAYGKICHFLCFVISQGKVVALDRWGGKWNHLSMTSRLTTDYAKNYCNRTLFVKVIVENVVSSKNSDGFLFNWWGVK